LQQKEANTVEYAVNNEYDNNKSDKCVV